MFEISLANVSMCLICLNGPPFESSGHSLNKGKGSVKQLEVRALDIFSLGNSAHGISSLIPPLSQQTFIFLVSVLLRGKSKHGICTNTKFGLGLNSCNIKNKNKIDTEIKCFCLYLDM